MGGDEGVLCAGIRAGGAAVHKGHRDIRADEDYDG